MNQFKKPQTNAWDVHIQRATTSPELAREYKKVSGDLNTHKIMATKIREGKPVGDGWLWGTGAAELILHRHIEEEELEPYRKAFLYDLAKQRNYPITMQKDKDSAPYEFNPYEQIKADLEERHRSGMEIVRQRIFAEAERKVREITKE